MGCARRFFRVSPPGYEWADNEHEALLVDVDWYTTATKSRPATAPLDSCGLDKYLGLPVVKRSHADDPFGNFWLCDKLLQSKFGLVPDPLKENL